MVGDTYLNWVITHTPTQWWHDSAEVEELTIGLERGAIGVTTNPLLANIALVKDRRQWAMDIEPVLNSQITPESKAEALMRVAVTKTAERTMPLYEASGGRNGLVCGQVNPLRAGDRQAMQAMARRYAAWAPNIVVKLPAVLAGLDVLEECVAEGITVAATVSFTVPQVIAIAERHRAGMMRARANGVNPGRCYAVLMIGRLDDFVREAAADNSTAVSESDICQAGLAVTKRAYGIFRERGYEAMLLVAALRGTYHLTELAGADLLMSIAPAYQQVFVTQDLPRVERIEHPVPPEVVDRLCRLPEFARAYEPDGMDPREFIGYGATQRTLGQFVEAGWKLIETLH